MIPQRIKLSGFLCYQTEQEIRFDGSQLWMLSGLNGSGKSSIFDAMTYALFGHHRGGATQAVELINKDSKAMAVEFDFKIDDSLYQIRRTLKRAKSGSANGSQQIHIWKDEHWDPIPGTQLKAQFDEWVREHIGLNYETFTSSVLLLQGKAEKLLDSKPSGRAEVLAGIVDLERYQKLHEKADTRRKSLKAELDVMQKQYEVVPDVSDMELLAAQNLIDDADERQKTAQQTVERLRNLEFQSRQWAEACQKLEKLRERLRRDEAVLADAARIEKEYQRLRELKEVLPQTNTILTQRSAIAESHRKSQSLEQEQITQQARLTELERNQTGSLKKRSSLEKTIATDEQRKVKIDAELRVIVGTMTKIRELDEQETSYRRLQEAITRLPNDPAAEVQRRERELDERMKLVRVVPILERFADARAKLMEQLNKKSTAEKEREDARRAGEEARKRKDNTEEQYKKAQEDRIEADRIATRAKTLHQQAEDLLREFNSLEGAKMCRHCGQPLTPAHFAVERNKRVDELETTKEQYLKSRNIQQAAQTQESSLRVELEKLNQELLPLRDKYKAAHKDFDSATEAASQYALDCRKAYFELPEFYQHTISPIATDHWPGTLYPTSRDLMKLKGEANDMSSVQRSLEEARKVQSNWEKFQSHLESTSQTIQRLKRDLPPQEVSEIRKQQVSLQSEETVVKENLNASRKTLQENQTELDRLQKEINLLGNQLTEIKGKLSTEEVTRKLSQERMDHARQLLPANWQSLVDRAGLSEQLGWKNEFEALTQRGVEQRFKDLEQARIGLNTLRHEIAERETECASFPADAQRNVTVIQQELEQAKAHATTCEETLRRAYKDLDVLRDYRNQRDKIRRDSLGLDREHNLYKLLSELLGRDRLQRHLVRQAERQIVDYANGVLDRLSGGQLFLRLCGGAEGEGTDRALDLEAFNRTTGGGAINVAFLSGSQRFRVAVSLALGIGQYASRQHRPIESVIIDEGFGCLDRQGRQGMIQELQNLRGHLHCILLVSHQEEFAEAFPDGYKFELQNGSTHVTRFAR